MIFDTDSMIALKGNIIIGIKTTNNFKMVDLVRLKKAIDSGVYDKSYDMNNDGILDQTDVSLLREIVLSNLF